MKTRPHGENTAGTQSIAFGERTLHYMVSRLCTQNGVNEIHKATQLHHNGFNVGHLFISKGVDQIVPFHMTLMSHPIPCL